jgi:hypothetical protein
MQDKTSQPMEQLNGAVRGIEEAISQAGATLFERRRTGEKLQRAKAQIAEAIGAIEAQLAQLKTP